MTAVPRFLIVIGFLATIQNGVDAFLAFNLPKKCDFGIYCNFTSRPGDTLTTSDFMFFPTLRILHDLRENSTIMKEYKGRNGFYPYTDRMLRVHANGYVYSRTISYVIGVKEDLLYPKTEPLSPHNKTYGSLQECLVEHCKRTGYDIHFLRCSPKTKNAVMWRDLNFTFDGTHITHECTDQIYHVDFRGIRIEFLVGNLISRKAVVRLRFEDGIIDHYNYNTWSAFSLLRCFRFIELSELFEVPFMQQMVADAQPHIEIKTPNHYHWVVSYKHKRALSTYTIASRCLTTSYLDVTNKDLHLNCYDDEFYDPLLKHQQPASTAAPPVPKLETFTTKTHSQPLPSPEKLKIADGFNQTNGSIPSNSTNDNGYQPEHIIIFYIGITILIVSFISFMISAFR